ncbi:MAG TPA: hypothetical protein VHA70_04065 [Bauldia sp.]|nr:hypothetical protein [Bauldia sp.]
MTRWLVVLAFAALTASAASAEDADWTYDPDNNKAVAIQKDHLLAVLCGENNLVTVYYSVPAAVLEKTLAERKTPYLAISIDGDLSGLSGYSIKAYPRDIDDVHYFVFQGKSAVDIAKRMAKADDHVLVTVSTKNPATSGKNYPRYQTNVFPAAGAEDAIAEMFENCPQD